MVDVKGLVDNVPVRGWVPLHPPDAEQLCALVAFHVNVAEWFIATVAGVDCNVIAGAAFTTGPPLPLICGKSSPQAASAAIAVNPKVQREIHEAIATEVCTLEGTPLWRWVRLLGTMTASPSSALDVSV